METLAQLAHLIHERNALDLRIAHLTHRPAYTEPLGKFIAAQVFDVRLLRSTAHPDIDGHFLSGPLAGRSFKVQWYSRQDGTLDLVPDGMPDEYLVFTGPPILPHSPPEITPAWVIERVYLFDSAVLGAQLQAQGLGPGFYTHLPQEVWDAAEIYPQASLPRLLLSEAQAGLLRLFAARQAQEPFPAAAPAATAAPPNGVPRPASVVLPPMDLPLPGRAAAPAAATTGTGLAGTAPLPPLPAGSAARVEPEPPSERTTERAPERAPERAQDTHPAPAAPEPAAAYPLPPAASIPLPAPARTEPPKIALRRWLSPSPTHPVAPPEEPAAAPAAPDEPASAEPPAELAYHDLPTTHDSRASDDLPATAKLPPLPPGARFPRPPALLGGEPASGGAAAPASAPVPASGAAPAAPVPARDGLTPVFVFPAPADPPAGDVLAPANVFPSPVGPAAGNSDPVEVFPAAVEQALSGNFDLLDDFPALRELPGARPSPTPANARPAGSLPKKYQRLESHLRSLPPDQDRLMLSFTQIEAIIADRLPASAHKQPAWWDNQCSGRHNQAQSWLSSGWRVVEIDLDQGWVQLQRQAASSS